MKTSEVLRKAGDVSRSQGWLQGRFGSCGGERCVVGAILEVTADSDAAWRPSWEILKDDVIALPGLTPSHWNDAPGRTHAEVLIALDAAYVLALQEEGVEPEDVL